MKEEDKKKAVQVVKSFMKKMNITIDESDFNNPLGWKNGFSVKYLENEKLRGGKRQNVYEIHFDGKDYVEYNKNGEIVSLIEGQKFGAYLDEDFNLLYVGTNHGYIEPDGTY